MGRTIDIVFTGPPGPHDECVFVEVEDESGASISVGTWTKRQDGFTVLRISDHRELQNAVNQACDIYINHSGPGEGWDVARKMYDLIGAVADG